MIYSYIYIYVFISEKRKLISAKAVSFAEQQRIAHSTSLKQQGAWLQWAENTLPFDMSWKNLIWGGISPLIIKFVLEASVNWVRTPNLLKLWGLKVQVTVRSVGPLSAPFITFFRTALLHCMMKGTHGDITQFYLKFRRLSKTILIN